jgi:hypothetical protein
LTSKQAILACVQDTQNFLNEEHEIGMGRNKKFQPRNNNNSHNSNKLSGNSNSNGSEQLEPGICRKPKNHQWKECHDNPGNKGKKNGEVSSTEAQRAPSTKAKSQEGKKTSFVRFKEDIQEIQSDDESVESGKRSLAELWDISQALKTDDDELHPVTVITLTDKNGEHLAAFILID